MPYVSDAQRKFFNANRDSISGSVVDEYNKASKGKRLPKRKGKRKGKRGKRKTKR